MAGESSNAGEANVELDAEGKSLQLDAEKAKYREAIAKAQQAANQAGTPSLASLLPTITDAPKGEVTVGEKSGALGQWRAHVIVDALAAAIAERLDAALTSKSAKDDARILVVDDPSLLEGAWTARSVRDVLVRLERRLKTLTAQVSPIRDALESAIGRYEHEEPSESAISDSANRGEMRRMVRCVARHSQLPPRG